MHKQLLALATLFVFGFTNAQDTESISENGFKSGDVFITGSVGFSNSKTGDYKSESLTISPKAGYFVNDNIALGVSLSYNKSEGGDQLAQTETSMMAGLFGRYYFMPGSRFSVFTQLGVNYIMQDYEGVPGGGGPYDYTTSGVNIGFAPGVNYFISEHFSLEANFGILDYTTVTSELENISPWMEANEITTDSFNIGLDMASINIGLLYKF